MYRPVPFYLTPAKNPVEELEREYQFPWPPAIVATRPLVSVMLSPTVLSLIRII